MIHMASVWVPFTSESKEAIADYDEIRKEMKLALMECGRKLGTYLRKRLAMRRQADRRDVFERYIGEISQAVHAINNTDAKQLYEALLAQAKKRTAIADLKLDEEGKKVDDDPSDQEGVIIVEQAAEHIPVRADGDAPEVKLTRAQRAALKVAAMGKDDDQPTLMDVDEPKRLNQKGNVAKKAPGKAKGEAAAKAPQPKPKSKSDGKKTSPPPAEDIAPAAAPAAKSTKPKLRMRLVNGKLVPVDDGPGLF
jgi:hypothetical protein